MGQLIITLQIISVIINQKQTKIRRPTQHFNVISHSVTSVVSREPSSGTPFYNNLKKKVSDDGSYAPKHVTLRYDIKVLC